MLSKYRMVAQYNKEARREIEAAGSPRGGGHFGFGYDALEVWGVHNDDLDEYVEAIQKRYRWCIRPKRRHELKHLYYRWSCRRAAASGLEITWM